MAETGLSVVLYLAARVPPLRRLPEFFLDVLGLVNDKEVSDHHALIPTLELKRRGCLRCLWRAQYPLLLAYCAMCGGGAVYEVVTAAFDCGGHTFTAKGKQAAFPGWRTSRRCSVPPRRSS